MQIPSALISCVKEGFTPISQSSFRSSKPSPEIKSLPRGKSLQGILDRKACRNLLQDLRFWLLMRGWKIKGCVLRSVCQQLPGLAWLCSWRVPTLCCTDAQAGWGQISSSVLVQCFTSRCSWHMFACQPLCWPSSGSSDKKPKDNDGCWDRWYVHQSERYGKVCFTAST